MNNISVRFSKLIFTALLSVPLLILAAMPAWATEEDVTHEVASVKTEHKWFYWPGWAFVALLVAIVGLILFAWLKSVIFPKYRGRKVVQ